MNKAVFLDRDGVINELIYKAGEGLISPRTLEEFRILPKVKDVIKEIKKMNFKVVVISNQPDVCKGKLKEENLKKMTEKMKKEIGIDAVYYCLHHPKFTGECECRKPKPGLLLMASYDLGIDLNKSYIIGDSLLDIEAGKVCKKTFLIAGGPYSNLDETDLKPDFLVSDLNEAVEKIKKIEGFK